MFSKVPLVGMLLLVVASLALLGCPKQPDIGRPGDSQAAASSSPVGALPPEPVASPPGSEPRVSRPTLSAETPVGSGTGPGAAGARVGPGGAPGTGATGPAAGQAGGAAGVSPLKDVYFEYDRHTILEDQKATLGQNIAWLKANPGVKVTIEGHCDERGTVEYNLGLGERRARAVKEFLVGGGIPANRLDTISYGKERPQVLGHDENAWKWNRRVHFAATAR